MSTVTQGTRSVKSRRRELSAELEFDDSGHPIVRINGTPYSLEDLPQPAAGRRLEKLDGTTYEVSDAGECTCPDYLERHKGLDTLGCKHVKALRMLGLLEPPAIAAAPEPKPTLRPGIDRVRDELDEPPAAPEPAPPLEDWLRQQAARYRSAWGGPHGPWLAGRLDGLADLARMLEAKTGDALDGREWVLERERDERLMARGEALSRGR
jgi:hypothetical protein